MPLIEGRASLNRSLKDSPRGEFWKENNGGGERSRTDDPLLAKQVLYQLSYTPIFNNKEEFRQT